MMPDPKPRPPATLTPEQGILWIDSILKDIRSHRQLDGSDFGQDVSRSLLSMRARLKDGGFFSLKMQTALENWNKGVSKWLDRSGEDRGTIQ